MTGKPIGILCVDDHTFLAEGLRVRISMEHDMHFLGWLPDAGNLVAEVANTGADVVLMDIEMPGPDPFETIRELRRQFPEVRTILFSAYVRDHYIDAAFQSGAWGYASKSDTPDSLIEIIRRVGREQFVLGPKVRQRCRAAHRPHERMTPPASRIAQLTKRELEILRMIGKGMGRLQIARTISRSPKTVDNHRAAIMEKLGIHDRAELIRYAIGEGLIEP